MSNPVLRIEGRLGPVSSTDIEIRPLTVFIGPQGTGKSLVSQMAYFFENLRFLVRYYEARLGPEVSDEKIIRKILDDLRSQERALGVFANPSVTLCWRSGGATELCFSMERRNRQIRPRQSLVDAVNASRMRGNAPVAPVLGSALFVPAERVLYSHASGPAAWQVLSLPSTLTLFAEAMDRVGKRFDDIHRSSAVIKKLWLEVLGGEVHRHGERWKWQADGHTQMDIGMASSGQKANWPLLALAEALPVWKNDREIATPFTLHVEEPEIHLHPQAQTRLVELLASLVKQGFRLVLTTHSLTVIYKLNNLILASGLEGETDDSLPAPEARLLPSQVAAYLFHPDGTIENLVDDETGFISEAPLGEIGDQLMEEMNAIMARRVMHDEIREPLMEV